MKLSRGFIFTFLCSLNWAVAIILTRTILTSGENPYNLTFWTMLLALPYWMWIAIKKKNISKLTRYDVYILIAIAFIITVFVSFLEVLAIQNSSAVNFSFLFRTVTAFTIIFAYFFLKEPLTKKKIILVTLLLLGSYFLTTGGSHITLTRGDLFTLAEAAAVALGTGVLGKLAATRMPADTAAVGRYGLGLLPVLLFAASKTTIQLPSNWFIVLSITALNMVFLQTMYRAFRYVSASYFTMIMSLTPVLVTLFAVPLLGETLTPIQIIGGGLIVLAGILVEKLKI